MMDWINFDRKMCIFDNFQCNKRKKCKQKIIFLGEDGNVKLKKSSIPLGDSSKFRKKVNQF